MYKVVLYREKLYICNSNISDIKGAISEEEYIAYIDTMLGGVINGYTWGYDSHIENIEDISKPRSKHSISPTIELAFFKIKL